MNSYESIKNRTIELYDMLPLDKDERKARLDIRDEIFELNYKFFGYIASHTYIKNTAITYEDKFQVACRSFLDIWWKYRWGDKYRRDLAFSVFFKPRISEMIQRELNEVKYSVVRSLSMKVADQLGIHWSKVSYDNIKDAELSQEDRAALQAVFGAPYKADLDVHAVYLDNEDKLISIDNEIEDIGDNYNDIEQFLINEMVATEAKISDKQLLQFSDILGIDISILRKKLISAENTLHKKLLTNIEIQEQFM